MYTHIQMWQIVRAVIIIWEFISLVCEYQATTGIVWVMYWAVYSTATPPQHKKQNKLNSSKSAGNARRLQQVQGCGQGHPGLAAASL